MSARDGEARRLAGIRREGRPADEVRWRVAIARQDRAERLEAEDPPPPRGRVGRPRHLGRHAERLPFRRDPRSPRVLAVLDVARRVRPRPRGQFRSDRVGDLGGRRPVTFAERLRATVDRAALAAARRDVARPRCYAVEGVNCPPRSEVVGCVGCEWHTPNNERSST